jgi:N-acetylmuramate 1-kinase
MSAPTEPPARTAADSRPEPAGSVTWNSPQRRAHFERWLGPLALTHGLDPGSLRAASADASFRRYLRIDGRQGPCIVMDAPPELEDAASFVKVARLMAAAELRVPRVLDWNPADGFLLLSDLGMRTMMQVLDPANTQAALAHHLDANEALIAWQLASQPGVLPEFDPAMMRREMELFAQWYVAAHRGIELDASERNGLDASFERIAQECCAWPSVYVHADFMPRNLMLWDGAATDLAARQRLGVLDFQDAVHGPITYDIASLMRDAFLSWDESFVIDVTVRYWERARAAGLPVGEDFGAFYRGVEWMGLQRHLRIAGVFARLSLRDGKPHYLADAPRFIGYIRATASRYGALRPLLRLIDRIEGTQPQVGYAIGRV